MAKILSVSVLLIITLFNNSIPKAALLPVSILALLCLLLLGNSRKEEMEESILVNCENGGMPGLIEGEVIVSLYKDKLEFNSKKILPLKKINRIETYVFKKPYESRGTEHNFRMSYGMDIYYTSRGGRNIQIRLTDNSYYTYQNLQKIQRKVNNRIGYTVESLEAV